MSLIQSKKCSMGGANIEHFAIKTQAHRFEKISSFDIRILIQLIQLSRNLGRERFHFGVEFCLNLAKIVAVGIGNEVDC